ncbi:peptide deformylase, partial [Bacillus cereus]|nr:peptide deformylase [Bacillus cereus]
GAQVGPEGSLSVPALYGEVERADYLKGRAQNRRGKVFLLEAEGFFARAIQQEIDQLHGVVFKSKGTRYKEENVL